MSLKAQFTIIVSETLSEHHKFVQISRYMNIVNMNIEMRANKGLYAAQIDNKTRKGWLYDQCVHRGALRF